jgi:hypothetical protein
MEIFMDVLFIQSRCVSAKKFLGLFGGLLLVCAAVPGTAVAANGFINVSSCGICQTTAQFVSAATTQATALAAPGTYMIVGSRFGATAYIKVTGTVAMVVRDGSVEPVLRAINAFPIDASGNSLAGASEGAQEITYATLDQTTFGSSRDTPAYFSVDTIETNEFGFPGSFINSNDAAVASAVAAMNSAAAGGNQVNLALGMTVAVTFADGSTAQYTVVSTPTGTTLVWNGLAWNNQHKLINKQGVVQAGPSTSGTGGGSVSVSGLGTGGGNYSFSTAGSGACTTSTTVTLNGAVIYQESHQLPC